MHYVIFGIGEAPSYHNPQDCLLMCPTLVLNVIISFSVLISTQIAGSWGQHGAHLGPTVPRWAICWPRELCYLESWTIYFFLVAFAYFMCWTRNMYWLFQHINFFVCVQKDLCEAVKGIPCVYCLYCFGCVLLPIQLWISNCCNDSIVRGVNLTLSITINALLIMTITIINEMFISRPRHSNSGSLCFCICSHPRDVCAPLWNWFSTRILYKGAPSFATDCVLAVFGVID